MAVERNLGGSFGSVTLKLDPQALDRLLSSPNGPVARDMIAAGEMVKQEAQKLVGVSEPDPVPRSNPRRPGTLRDSILKRIGTHNGRFAVLIGSEQPYALYHHEGTQPHEITPKKAPLLVFHWAKVGRVVAFPRVNHPGTQPNRFLTEALRVLRGRY